jgi:hypothetical protein
MNRALLELVVLLLTSGGILAADDAPTRAPDAGRGDKVLVGVNYFAGWWESLPNKWHGKGWAAQEPDWRLQFPGRVPLLGCYNEQRTMDREIAAAAGHGVDFFLILWYFPKPGSGKEEDANRLNHGAEQFVASPKAGLMHFAIEYCNAPDFSATTDGEWSACVKTWVAMMKHPSCLRVDGRLVFKIHDADRFWRTHDRDIERCRQHLKELREAVRAAGLGEMLIGGGIMSRSGVSSAHFATKMFDFTACYMSVPPAEPRDEEYPFATLAQEAREARVFHAQDPIPWMPYLAAGWNPRPWTTPKAGKHHQCFFTFPTREEWTEELRALKEDFKKYPRLGLPCSGGRRQAIFNIYAWNEFGEGGIVAPTEGEKSMKLEAIRGVFSSHP